MPIVLALCSVKWTVSPRWTRMTGPGAVPSNVHTWYVTGVTPAPAFTIFWSVSIAVRLTLTTVPFATAGVKARCDARRRRGRDPNDDAEQHQERDDEGRLVPRGRPLPPPTVAAIHVDGWGSFTGVVVIARLLTRLVAKR